MGLLALLNAEFQDATSIAAAVLDGRRSAVAVLREARERAEAHRADRAFISEDWDAAFVHAARVDAQIAAGEDPGPLAGVPVSVKDVIAVAGLPLTAASHVRDGDAPVRVSATAVTRLLEAGAVVVGKTNCPEFAMGITCTSPVGGSTANPRFPGRTPGGSSGGEAASLAAGVTALGVGTDFGGSLRWPAQCVGIAALRPGRGSVPGDGTVPGRGGSFGDDAVVPVPTLNMQGMLQVIGPMARSIDDLRTAWRLMAGHPPVRHAVQSSTNEPLRVVWSDGSQIVPVRAEVTAMMGRLASRLRSAGHHVVEDPAVFAGCLEAYNNQRSCDPMLDHASAVEGRQGLLGDEVRAMIADSLTHASEHTQAMTRVAEAAALAALTVFDRADVVLLPVAGTPAASVDGEALIDGRPCEGWELMGLCRSVTLTGAPTVSLPVALSGEGWPLSIQVVTAPGREEFALDIADLLESLN